MGVRIPRPPYAIEDGTAYGLWLIANGKGGKLAFRFENLEIWKLALEYSEQIHKLIKKFPKSEMFGLSSDLNRAAISISSNIAEGSGSDSKREFKRYLGIAKKSLFETISQLYVAERRLYISENELYGTYRCGEVLVKKMVSFIKRIN